MGQFRVPLLPDLEDEVTFGMQGVRPGDGISVIDVLINSHPSRLLRERLVLVGESFTASAYGGMF